ncbi:PEP-CTERM sorting domain-containing protein [Methylobacillus sp. Pita2]|uniref:PEP-CTERM sorting domain-containing protein n=1 Tax=Methylobacillus sp. Pita2 TaxID=3383245 RepID=UPI0038B48FBE
MNKSVRIIVAITALFSLSHPVFADVTWNGSTGDWIDSSKWSGATVPGSTDNAIINSGEIYLSGDVHIDTLTLNNGLIRGSGSMTTNNLYWNTGSINFSPSSSSSDNWMGVLTVNGNAVLGSNGSSMSLEGGTSPHWCDDCGSTKLILNGNTTLEGALTAATGAIVNNGTMTLKEGSNTYTSYWNRWWSPLVNNGTIDANPGAAKVARLFNLFDNDGVIEVSSGTLLVDNYYGAVNNKVDSSFRVKSGASFVLGNESEGQRFSNNGGEVIIEAGASYIGAAYTQNSGTTKITDASFVLTDVDGFQIYGGDFVANGNLKGIVNIFAGNVSLGETPNQLNIDGDLYLRSDSNFTINIAGLQQGISYDSVNFTGYMIANGALNINFDSFIPTIGSTFNIFNGSVFSDELGEYGLGYSFLQVNVNGLDLNQFSYNLDYSSSGISFTVLAVPEPSSYAMLLLGLSVLGFVARRLRKL